MIFIKNGLLRTIIIALFLSIPVYLLSSRYDILERFVEFSRQHEDYELDEIAILLVFASIIFGISLIRSWFALRKAKNALIINNMQLQNALSEIKQLRGFLPISAACKKIRDDKGYWQQIEDYISGHTEAIFTHSICPECTRNLYPELANHLDETT
jgi:hypothetical protein